MNNPQQTFITNSAHVALGVPSDLKYVRDLQKQWSNNLGFLPSAALRRYLQNEHVLLVKENNQNAGYLLWDYTKRDNIIKITQVAIEPELLRIGIGTLVMKYLESRATASSCTVLRLKTRFDLEANLVWPTLGWKITATFHPENARHIPIHEWTKQLPTRRPSP